MRKTEKGKRKKDKKNGITKIKNTVVCTNNNETKKRKNYRYFIIRSTQLNQTDWSFLGVANLKRTLFGYTNQNQIKDT